MFLQDAWFFPRFHRDFVAWHKLAPPGTQPVVVMGGQHPDGHFVLVNWRASVEDAKHRVGWMETSRLTPYPPDYKSGQKMDGV